MCQSNGIWSGSSTTCPSKYCAQGQRQLSPPTHVCICILYSIYLWHYFILPHVVVSCNVPSTPSNGQHNYSRRSYGDRVTFSCNSGYLLTGSSSMTCQSNGHWSGTQPSCVSKWSELVKCSITVAAASSHRSGPHSVHIIESYFLSY